MSTLPFIFIGVVFTIAVVSIILTHSILSQSKKHDAQVAELLKQRNKTK